MLYRILKRMIERGQTANLADKLDIFFATGRITEEEYTELTGMLKEKKQGKPPQNNESQCIVLTT